MSEPLSDTCIYCGSSDVLDDAWWCDKPLCWLMYEKECKEAIAYEKSTLLTRGKAYRDLATTKACVWGTPYMEITHALDKLLACVYVRRDPILGRAGVSG